MRQKCLPSTKYRPSTASIEYIRWKNANCRIFLVTIPPNDQYKALDTTSQNYELRYNNTHYAKVREKILAIADKMSVQVIDAQVHAGLGEWGIGYWIGNDLQGGGYHVHPNAIGKELWASYVAHELEKQFYETNLT